MAKRVVSAVVLIALTVGAFYYSLITRVAFVGICGVIACYELARALKKLGRPAVWPVPCAFAAACAVTAYFLTEWLSVIPGMLIAAMVLAFAAVMFTKGGSEKLISTLAMLIYPCLPMALILHVAGGEMSKNLIIFVTGLGSSILCDTFALFTGMAFGKHKLAPSISPKKTIEGSLGGSLITVIIALNLWLYMPWFNSRMALAPFLICVFCCTVTGQVGDLAASYIKRAAKIKDYGRLIPGHGGMLDRIDSMLFSIPTAMIFFTLFT